MRGFLLGPGPAVGGQCGDVVRVADLPHPVAAGFFGQGGQRLENAGRHTAVAQPRPRRARSRTSACLCPGASLGIGDESHGAVGALPGEQQMVALAFEKLGRRGWQRGSSNSSEPRSRVAMSTTGSILIVGTYIRLRSKLIAGRRFGPEAFRLADPAPPLIPSRYRAGAWG